MGQYDYQGTPQSRMYDWLVTREGASLSLCVREEPHHELDNEREVEDLEYIRSLVAHDQSFPEAVLPEVEALIAEGPDPAIAAVAARSGGTDYYDNPDGSSKIPKPLGTTGELGVIQVIK